MGRDNRRPDAQHGLRGGVRDIDVDADAAIVGQPLRIAGHGHGQLRAREIEPLQLESLGGRVEARDNPGTVDLDVHLAGTLGAEHAGRASQIDAPLLRAVLRRLDAAAEGEVRAPGLIIDGPDIEAARVGVPVEAAGDLVHAKRFVIAVAEVQEAGADREPARSRPEASGFIQPQLQARGHRRVELHGRGLQVEHQRHLGQRQIAHLEIEAARPLAGVGGIAARLRGDGPAPVGTGRGNRQQRGFGLPVDGEFETFERRRAVSRPVVDHETAA